MTVLLASEPLLELLESPRIIDARYGVFFRLHPASIPSMLTGVKGIAIFDHIQLLQEELSGREKFNLVRELKFFVDFGESEIWEVINASSWLEFEPGTEIIIEGDIDNSFYVIVNGEVIVRKRTQDVDVLVRGDCFGEMGFIARRKRTATIIAKTQVSAMKVRASLIERASLNCQLRFHKVFLNTLVERLSLATERISTGP